MKISEAISKVQKESENNILLCIEELVTESQLKEIDFEGSSKSTRLFVTGRHLNDILKGAEFDVIFEYDNPNNNYNIRTKIVNFSMRKGQYLDVLPEGYGGGVLIDFLDEIPEIIDVLDRERGNYKALYLTTQTVMNRILELL